MKPKSNNKEFEHLKLMLDLRLFYLDSKMLESEYESDFMAKTEKTKMKNAFSELIDRSKKLDQRFSALNKGFLYPSEIEEQNRIRSQKVRNIYETLKGNR